MSVLVVRGGRGISGSVRPPGDKSISHRALMLAGIANGTSRIRGLASGEDVASTVACLEVWGVSVDAGTVTGPGIQGWQEPEATLDCGNSGTTMRLLSGLAARREFVSVLDGDASLRRRPMDRVIGPLSMLGARVEALNHDRFPPLLVSGGHLNGAKVTMEVASAQVKSAVLLAGLGAEGPTTVTESVATRDHTERMLAWLGAPIDVENGLITVEAFDVPPFELDVAADPSSAAYVLAAGVLCGSTAVTDIYLNPGRMGFVDLLARMGADLDTFEAGERGGEPVGTVSVRRSALRGIEVGASDVPSSVDELPLLAVVATQADGTTCLTGAGELRVKECDRVSAIVEGLRRMGAEIEEHEDGFTVEGPTPLAGAEVVCYGDHRIAMTLAVAGLVAEGETAVEGFEAASVSWPGFGEVLSQIGADVEVR